MTVQNDPEGREKKVLHKFVDFTNQRVLEIGCGEGRMTWKYASASSWIVGVDTDRNALRVAAYDHPSNLAKKVHFANSEAERLPFRKETFDIAVLAWSL
ncbi:MAG TPA: class I SAM-dependent methyltransferase [Anaerolineales bacterium]|nr:class I SAM-dependent methyltransferase [Anaerolineales bacterium]